MIKKEYISITNEGGRYQTTVRKDFRCLRVTISPDDPFMDKIWKLVETIRMNAHSANTGEIRTDKIVIADKLTGLIAEYICYEMLADELGKENVIKPESYYSHDQIDIKLNSNETIEVRSSCIRNGIKFALFNVNNEGKQYIDVVGPYYNSAYKSYENVKDFYMRVIYEGEKSFVLSEIMNHNYIVLYITGGATKQMLGNKGYLKYMTSPDDCNAEQKGQYLVVPMSESLDYPEFIRELNSALK